MFGKNLKYVLILGALGVLAFTSPAVIDAITSGMAYTQEQAAAGDIGRGGPGGLAGLFKVEIKDRMASTSVRRDMGSTTRPMPFATSTRPIGKEIKEMKEQDRRINPQDVVTILFKAGIIPQNKLDEARKIINNAQLGTSTMGSIIRQEVKDIRDERRDDRKATSTRMLPPPPPVPPTSTSTTI